MKMTPISSGLVRSASRMTWQIVKELAPPEKPEGWHIPYGHIDDHAKMVWPFRTHKHVPVNSVPVIYTYRHPIEAFLSYRSRVEQDKEDRDALTMSAMIQMATGWEIFKRYRQDQVDGRDVLFLKYEDLYYDHPERVRLVAAFMDIDIDEEEVARIVEKTSLKNNIEWGRAVATDSNATFGQEGASCGESGMQRLHVNEKTMGVPEVWMEAHPEFVDEVRNPTMPATKALQEMCIDMGYKV